MIDTSKYNLTLFSLHTHFFMNYHPSGTQGHVSHISIANKRLHKRLPKGLPKGSQKASQKAISRKPGPHHTGFLLLPNQTSTLRFCHAVRIRVMNSAHRIFICWTSTKYQVPSTKYYPTPRLYALCEHGIIHRRCQQTDSTNHHAAHSRR